ncbi:MAG: protease modulator HflC [Sedimentisphaerales bacterium]|nr:protease modulator HflC [Sedimentisphaerales bacterium]
MIPTSRKPNGRFLALLALAALAATILGNSLYVVDQSQQALVTQFGKPVRVVINPIEGPDSEAIAARLKARYDEEGIAVARGAGLRGKIPFIQKVVKFERRLLRWNGYPEQIPTKDKKYIWVDSTARWCIEDPLLFFRSVGTEEQAHARLDDIIDSSTRNSITKRDLLEIVRTDNREMQVAEEELQDTAEVGSVEEGRIKIVAEITEASRKACEEYGISIPQAGILIKGLTYVDEVKQKVEERMREERQRIAKKYISEGEGDYEKIMGDKEREVKVIMSEAYKQAQEIEGGADAGAAEIYAKAFSKDPEFYRFIKTLELYEEAIASDKTRLILGTDNPLFELIKGNPLKAGGKTPEKGAVE